MGRQKKVITSVEFIYCACGCGFTRPKRGTDGIIREFIYGHQNRRRLHNEEHKRKISMSLLGNTRNFKGNNVGYHALHHWIRKYLPSSKICQICNKIPSYDLANITGTYNRDFSNWKYLCRSCHMTLDGRLYNLKQYQSK